MSRNSAFRLCGELAKLMPEIGFNFVSGNTVRSCVDAALELLDTASSLISLHNNRKRTRNTTEFVCEAEQARNKTEESERELDEIIFQAEKSKFEERIEKLRIELEREKISFEREMDNATTELNAKASANRKREHIISSIREKAKEGIDLVVKKLEELKEDEDQHHTEIAELEEALRLSHQQYNNLLKTCF